ncbi:MAG: BglG family transcription antiterminator [Erysipelotrichaceae bacterium]
MKLKKIEIEIIKLLFSSSVYLSSYDIATTTRINRRAVRVHMSNIKRYLNELGYPLTSKPSKGYLLEGRSSKSLKKLQKIIENAELQREFLYPTLPDDRQSYIMKRLIDKNDYIKIDNLADELYIHRSTVSNDIKSVKKTLFRYDLVLINKPNYGIAIIGDEVNKRKPLCDSLFTNLKKSGMFYDFLDSYFAKRNSFEFGIIQIIQQSNIELSDIALCDFLLCLSVSTSRILNGYTITKSPDVSIIKNRTEFSTAITIAKYLEKHTGCHINVCEINQIAIQLICKRSSKGINIVSNPLSKKLVKEILQVIEEETLLTFNNLEFKEIFTLYVDSALLRSQFKEKIRNPLFDLIKEAYPLAYELAEISSHIIYKNTNKHLSMSELAFFANIFHAHIYTDIQVKKKTLLVCSLGSGSEFALARKILDRFSNKIEISKSAQYYQLPDMNLHNFDLIISTAPIHKELLIPYLNISNLVNNDDLDKIDNYLSYFFKRSKLETLFHPKLYSLINIVNNDSINISNKFYQLLKLQYPELKSTIRNSLIRKNNTNISNFKNKITLIKLDKPMKSYNLLSVIVFNKPTNIFSLTSQIVVLFSTTDNDNYLFNTLVSLFDNVVNDEISFRFFFANPTYQNFLSMLKYNQ